MVLEAIDLQLETSKQEKMHVDGHLTVEHIMPQHWSEKYWPLPSVAARPKPEVPQ